MKIVTFSLLFATFILSPHAAVADGTGLLEKESDEVTMEIQSLASSPLIRSNEGHYGHSSDRRLQGFNPFAFLRTIIQIIVSLPVSVLQAIGILPPPETEAPTAVPTPTPTKAPTAVPTSTPTIPPVSGSFLTNIPTLAPAPAPTFVPFPRTPTTSFPVSAPTPAPGPTIPWSIYVQNGVLTGFASAQLPNWILFPKGEGAPFVFMVDESLPISANGNGSRFWNFELPAYFEAGIDKVYLQVDYEARSPTDGWFFQKVIFRKQDLSLSISFTLPNGGIWLDGKPYDLPPAYQDKYYSDFFIFDITNGRTTTPVQCLDPPNNTKIVLSVDTGINSRAESGMMPAVAFFPRGGGAAVVVNNTGIIPPAEGARSLFTVEIPDTVTCGIRKDYVELRATDPDGWLISKLTAKVDEGRFVEALANTTWLDLGPFDAEEIYGGFPYQDVLVLDLSDSGTQAPVMAPAPTPSRTGAPINIEPDLEIRFTATTCTLVFGFAADVRSYATPKITFVPVNGGESFTGFMESDKQELGRSQRYVFTVPGYFRLGFKEIIIEADPADPHYLDDYCIEDTLWLSYDFTTIAFPNNLDDDKRFWIDGRPFDEGAYPDPVSDKWIINVENRTMSAGVR